MTSYKIPRTGKEFKPGVGLAKHLRVPCNRRELFVQILCCTLQQWKLSCIVEHLSVFFNEGELFVKRLAVCCHGELFVEHLAVCCHDELFVERLELCCHDELFVEHLAVRYDSGGNCVVEHLAVRCNSDDLTVMWNILRYAAIVMT